MQVSDLTCQPGERTLFSGVSFVLKAGQLLVVEGGNGSGKTTLLGCLAGAVTDYQGQVNLHGATSLIMGHSTGMTGLLNVIENLTWYRALRGRHFDNQAVMIALRKVGLAGFEHQTCNLLSAGQKRRAALARLLLEPVDIWFLDEPVTALDDDGVRLVQELCEQQLESGGAVVISTHRKLEFKQATHLLQLHEGTHQLTEAGPVC